MLSLRVDTGTSVCGPHGFWDRSPGKPCSSCARERHVPGVIIVCLSQMLMLATPLWLTMVTA